MVCHCLLARVVASQDKFEVALELLHQKPEEFNPTFDVFSRIKDVLHTEPDSRVGMKLHETHATLGRHGPRIEVALGRDDSFH